MEVDRRRIILRSGSRRLAAAGVLATLMFLTLAQAQEPPATNASSQLQAVLVRLNSSSRAERTRAERDLLNMGEAVLNILPEPRSIEPVGVREIVLRVRAELERAAALRAVQPEQIVILPSPTLLGVLNSFMQVSGERLIMGALEPELRRRSWQGEMPEGTFFAVLDQLTARAGLDWRWSRAGRQIELLLDPLQQRAADPVYDRAFRISLLQVRTQTNFIDPEVRRILQLALAVDIPPRLIPYRLMVIDREFTPKTDAGQIALFNPEARREILPNGGRFLFPLLLSLPVQDRSPVLQLPGMVHVRLAARPVPLQFGLDSLSAEPKRIGNQKVRLVAREFEGALLRIRLEVEFDSFSPELESHRLGGLHRDAVLRLADGTELRPELIQLVSVDGLTHEVEYRFRTTDSVSGGSFIYVAPTLVTDIPVTFELRDIPLSGI